MKFFLLTLPLVMLACQAHDSFEGVTFRVGHWVPLSSLHPFERNGTTENIVFMALYEGLVRLDKAGNIIPGLAQSWQINADNTSITFTLRPNLRFSDGYPINSLTVAASKWYFTGRFDNTFVSTEIIDERTLRFNYSQPRLFIAEELIRFYILPIHIIEQHGSRWHLPQNHVSSGPFKLHSLKTDGSLTLLANPNY